MSTTSHEPPRVTASGGPPAGPRPDPGRSGGARPGWWAPLVRLHFYAGVLVAPFLVVAALTGLAYACTPQLDRLVYGDELHTAGPAGPARPLSDQIAAARSAHPEGTIGAVIPAAAPGATTRVVLSVPGLAADAARTVYVDPSTAEVTGALITRAGDTPLTWWLSGLHRDLHLGAVGALYSELAASWLLVIVPAGAALWLGRRRRYRGGAAAARALWPNRRLRRRAAAARAGHGGCSGQGGRVGRGGQGGRSVRRVRGRHAAVGLWTALGLLVLGGTGLTWSNHAGARFDLLQQRLDATAPELRTRVAAEPAERRGAQAGPVGDGTHADHRTAPRGADVSPVRWEQALSVARAARLDGPVVITSPVAAGRAWTVAQAGDRWPVRRDAIAVDPGRWRVVDRVDWADHPLPAKLTTLGVLLHMGRLFGPLNQLALAGTALALLAMIGWGYRMWWLRRPRRAGRRAMGRPPARTGWRALPHRGPVIAVALPVVAFAGWAVPLLGLSLVAFVLLDGVARAVVRRRAAPSDRGPGRRSR